MTTYMIQTEAYLKKVNMDVQEMAKQTSATGTWIGTDLFRSNSLPPITSA